MLAWTSLTSIHTDLEAICLRRSAVLTGCDIQVLQAAKGMAESHEVFLDLLGPIKRFLKRLDVYTTGKIPPTPAVDEMVVKIMVDPISTRAGHKRAEARAIERVHSR